MTTPAYLTQCELRTINLTHGEQDYVWIGFEDQRKQDLTGDSVQISPDGTYDGPGTWYPADLTEQNGAVYKIRAGLFIGTTVVPPLNIYYVWFTVGDSPAVIVRRVDNRLLQLI